MFILKWVAAFWSLFTKNAWQKEFGRRGIPFVAQKELQLAYKGEPLRQFFKPDFICNEKIIVEIKAVKALAA